MNSFNVSAFDIASTISLVLSSSIDSYIGDDYAPAKYSDYSDARMDIITTLKAKFPKMKSTSGAYRTALVFDDFVVKFSLDVNRQHAIVEEAHFIDNMREDEKFARHFPETHVVQIGAVPVLVQQKVNMSHRGITWEMREQVERLADYLGISDMHEENYGWAGPDHKLYPVFVDVDLRDYTAGRDRHRRSWFV